MKELKELARVKILPWLSAIYDEINNKYDNCLSGLYVLKNPESGNCLTKNYKYFYDGYILELYFEFDCENYQEIAEAWNYIINALDKNRSHGKTYAYMYLNGTKDYSNLFILHRKGNDGFCVRSKQTDKKLLANNYMTIKNIFDNFGDEMALQYLTHNFPYYSWEMKRKCLSEEPVRYDYIERKDYVLCAALTHKYANDNYLEVPSWISDPYYTSPEPYYFGYTYDVPEEFKQHNFVANMVDFTNV